MESAPGGIPWADVSSLSSVARADMPIAVRDLQSTSAAIEGRSSEATGWPTGSESPSRFGGPTSPTSTRACTSRASSSRPCGIWASFRRSAQGGMAQGGSGPVELSPQLHGVRFCSGSFSARFFLLFQDLLGIQALLFGVQISCRRWRARPWATIGSDIEIRCLLLNGRPRY